MMVRKALRNRLLKRVFLAVLTVFLSYSGYMKYSTYVKPFLAYLDEGTEIHYYYYKDNHLPERLKRSRLKFDSSFLRIYSFSIEKKENVLQLYKTLGENPYRNRHVAIINPGKRKAYGILAKIISLEFEKREVALIVFGIFDFKLTEEDLNRKSFRGEIAFDPSYFPVLSHAEGGKMLVTETIKMLPGLIQRICSISSPSSFSYRLMIREVIYSLCRMAHGSFFSIPHDGRKPKAGRGVRISLDKKTKRDKN